MTSFNLPLAKKLGLTREEISLFRKLSTPVIIQDFVTALPSNLEKKEETLYSPRRALREHTAHCIEAVLLVGLAFYLNGREPLIIDMRARNTDQDHCIAPFKEHGLWGAISKSNRSILRYRDPVYKTVRELMMSYFHEYFLPTGVKSLIDYSEPFNLKKIKENWITGEDSLWFLDPLLNNLPHKRFIEKGKKVILRKVDPLELKVNSHQDFT